MYGSSLAAAVKVNGKVLREIGDQVFLPFGAEYTLLIKNLNSVRADVSVSIDGKDVTDGSTSFVIHPNSEVELERFLPKGNRDKGNRFKFIERTAAIEEHNDRGIRIDDGLIRLEYQFEQKVTHVPRVVYDDVWAGPYYPKGSFGGVHGSGVSFLASGVNMANITATMDCMNAAEAAPSAVMGWAGITAPGAVSEQKFQQASWFQTESTKHALIMRLVGSKDGHVVTAPVTVKAKQVCSSCGKVSKHNSKFCPRCGTGLELIS